MILLQSGTVKKATNSFSTKLKCGGEQDEGCGAVFQIDEQDVFKVVKPIPTGIMIFVSTLCPCCHQHVSVNYKVIPSLEAVPTYGIWLVSRQQALLATLYDENRDEWARIRPELVEEGFEQALGQIGI